MRFQLIFIFLILTGCSSPSPIKVAEGTKVSNDTCNLADLRIDTTSIETLNFRNFWAKAEKQGYTFNDDTIVPFVKVIFQPKSPRFYRDTFSLIDCKVLESVNIHRMEIRSKKPIQPKYYPNLIAEEWKFTSPDAALEYSKAWTDYVNKGYGLKSPTAIVYKDSAVYMFQTAAYMFIPELERMIKLFDPNIKIAAKNY